MVWLHVVMYSHVRTMCVIGGVCAGAEVSQAKRRRAVSDASEGSVEICKHHIGVLVHNYIT